VLENVIFGPKVRGDANAKEAKDAAQALLTKFGLAEFADKYPDQLSGGMKRRAEIAQALINRPEVMILDEPFRGLDVMTREILQEYYLDLFEETRQTTVFITSELEEALFLADKIYIMGDQPARILDIIDVDLPRPRDFEEGVEKGYYVKPTVFSQVTTDMTIAKEEIFGPVLSIIAYDDIDDAVRIANITDYGLAGGVWLADKDKATAVAKRMRTGQVEVNGGAFNPNAPFGGYKQSGNGREYGEYGFEEFLEIKSLQL
ncbi:MAG: aldehyde dehydrogenase family protein, partial [Ilumatobacteraceae bacterium]